MSGAFLMSIQMIAGGVERVLCVWGLDKIFVEISEAGVRGFPPCGDKTAARMGHPGFLPVLKRTRTTADPWATNKRTGNSNGKDKMRESLHSALRQCSGLWSG